MNDRVEVRIHAPGSVFDGMVGFLLVGKALHGWETVVLEVDGGKITSYFQRRELEFLDKENEDE